MLRSSLFLLSTAMALFGVGSAIVGIDSGEIKLLASGLILLFGAAVFALLFVGTRRATAIGNADEE